MDKVIEFLINSIKPFYRPRALFSCTIILIVILQSIDPFIAKAPISYIYYRWWVYLGIILLFICYWLKGRFRLPRKAPNKLNIVISIDTEYDEKVEILKKDLLIALKNGFSKGNLSDITRLIDLPNHFSQKIDGPEMVRKMNNKIGAQFWIWGRARRREGMIYLDLEGLVVHSVVDEEWKRNFEKDFRSALPERIEFHENLSFKASEITAASIYYTARYITGIAALLSNDSKLSLRLLKDLQTELKNLPPQQIPSTQFISAKLPENISEVYVKKAFEMFKNGEFANSRTEIDNALHIYHRSYSALILRSILEFSSNDADSALHTTKEAEHQAGKDKVWLFNRAFLLLWTKNFDEAEKLCRSISRKEFSNEGPISYSAYLFTKNLAEKEAGGAPMYFWMGLLLYKKLKNPTLALQYFERFLTESDDGMLILKKHTEEWLKEIKDTIGIN